MKITSYCGPVPVADTLILVVGVRHQYQFLPEGAALGAPMPCEQGYNSDLLKVPFKYFHDVEWKRRRFMSVEDDDAPDSDCTVFVGAVARRGKTFHIFTTPPEKKN
jgi:hypothetical protein